MRDFSLLDSAIDEMERVLLGNKPREAEEIYLQNAIDFIERFIKQLIEESKLNENQQIVLDWLKESCKLNGLSTVIEIMGFLPTTGGKMKYKQIAYAYADLNEVELAQVIQAFSQWAIEQEEE
ncbi:hypothetical protein [Enterococcus faecalis]|uniref:hypothetical protein n=1 Tax=Enterococcus faecalis TaxID=1351 RepID=UPI0037E0BC99|nr:hypothetical protein [Enterococcus faecalis]